jgi:hypothetical protein
MRSLIIFLTLGQVEQMVAVVEAEVLGVEMMQMLLVTVVLAQ